LNLFSSRNYNYAAPLALGGKKFFHFDPSRRFVFLAA
jgi:hypothetical protein